MRCKRKTIVVDKEMQFGLASRLLTYYVTTWRVIFGMPIVVMFSYYLFFTNLTFGALAAKLVDDLWFPIVMSLFVLPIVARDILRFSNRVAGPMFRFRRIVRQMSQGETVERIKIRKNDFGHAFAEELNMLIDRIQNDSQSNEDKNLKDDFSARDELPTENPVAIQ